MKRLRARTNLGVTAVAALAMAVATGRPASAQQWQVATNSLTCTVNGATSSCTTNRSGVLYSSVFSASMSCTKLTCPPQRANPLAYVATSVGVSGPCSLSVASYFTGSIQSTSGYYYYVGAVLQQTVIGMPWSVTASDSVDCDGVEGYVGPPAGSPPFNCGITY